MHEQIQSYKFKQLVPIDCKYTKIRLLIWTTVDMHKLLLGWIQGFGLVIFLLKIAEKIIKRQMFPKLHVLSLHVIVASKSVSHLKHVSNCQICRKMLLKEKIKLNAYSQGAQVSSHLSIMYCTFII